MKYMLLTSVTLALLAGCTNVTNTDKLIATDEIKNDDRGHAPLPMSQQRLEQLLETYDSGKDGELSWAEYNDWRRDRFDDTDNNGNGTVDTEEYVYEFEERLDDRLEKERTTQLKQTVVRFKALDKDESQNIEWAEYEAAGNRIFERWDKNGDGSIDDLDKKDSESKRQETNSSAIGMPTTHSLKGTMQIYDTDEDSVVSKEDFISSRRSEFHLADSNKNGKVDQDEYVLEFEDRLDNRISKRRRGSIKQTYVRFDVLDDNSDDMMTFDEFQISGKRIFTRWDKNQDGIISAADINS